MRDNEFRLLMLTVAALCSIIVVMGLRIEKLNDKLNERYNETPFEDVPAVPDSIPTWSDSRLEGMRNW